MGAYNDITNGSDRRAARGAEPKEGQLLSGRVAGSVALSRTPWKILAMHSGVGLIKTVTWRS